MIRQGDDFIIHGLFADDMMHIPTCDALKQEFMEKYTKDFDITAGGLTETFLGMQVEQLPGKIRWPTTNFPPFSDFTNPKQKKSENKSRKRGKYWFCPDTSGP
jgi:hypothetical protein